MTDRAASLYTGKNSGYFSAARLDLLEMLPTCGGLRILEVGAGEGATLGAAKARGLASYCVSLDIVAPPSSRDFPVADRVLVGNVETMDLGLPDADFDVVICADVIEHLVDPWTTVTRLARLLKSGGMLVSSIPNFRNHRVLRPILFGGDFRYADAGLLDRSHLRFFCRRNIHRLFEHAGLAVESIEENMGGYGVRHRVIDWLTFGLLHEFFVFQYRTRARKTPERT